MKYCLILCNTIFANKICRAKLTRALLSFPGRQSKYQPSHYQGVSMSENILKPADKRVSAEDYLSAERQNSVKNEYGDGKISKKPAANRWHNLIASNVAIAIGSRLHGQKGEIYVAGMRVQLKNNRICYPDVTIVGADPIFADSNSDLLLNPTIAVEIFSSKTNNSNKTERLESYLGMDSIRECLLVKEDEMRVEHYAKQNAKQWVYRIYNERDDVISIDSVNCKISLAELYAQIKFGQAHISSRAVN